MNKFQVRSALIILVTLVGISLAIGSLPQARAASTFVPHPFISPTVCTTDGVCFEVDNSGHGISVEGQALNKRGIGVRGLASSTTMVGTGVSGQAFGPSSIAVNGVAFSTDPNRASQGVDGLSANGTGVEGTTTFNSTLALTAASGVLGRDKSTAFAFDTGVEGTSNRGVGVAGLSQNGNAVTGSSTNANGVVGQTTFFALSGQGQAGVFGQDLATPGPLGTPTANAGVYGLSNYGTGVLGFSATGVAVDAHSGSGYALLAQSDSGPALIAQANNSQEGARITNSGAGSALDVNSGTGIALNVSGGGLGNPAAEITSTTDGNTFDVFGSIDGSLALGIDVQATTGILAYGVGGSALIASEVGQGTAPTLLVTGGNGSPLIVAQGPGNANEMSLDQSGNMILAGTLTQNGSPLVAHRARNGWGVGTYSAQQTTKTVEDLGEAQLQGGDAYVRLDPAFAGLMDKRSTYLVFLTPQGDCRGLYATEKGPGGFYVRELGSGRSSVAFDYRIVARPVDSDGARLPLIRPIQSYRGPIPTALPHAHSLRTIRRTTNKIRPGYVPSVVPLN